MSDKPPSDLVKVNFRIKEREYLEMKRLVASKKYSSISELVRHAIELLLEEYTGKV
ncbi:ribbon-helix-helix domain-containing protein [Infirmifilum uzonense]|uniref:ribbon-helix-helix domain-containing protein n=1 Tax=Infirmifilum uzonense TaxID=1550241 RepID=UPI00168D76A3|nr:ribbon-helix-helix domain-containing protein [Infirmifilum uzonense]